jgi:hypothetical protein
MSTSSEEVGETVASAFGEGPSRATLGAQRVLVIEMAQRSFRERSRPSAWTYALALLPVALAVVAVVAFARAPRTLEASFRGAPIAVDARLRAPEKTASSLDFSDGSQVSFEQNTRVTLSTLRPDHAALRLEAGRMSASIRKHPGMSWTVAAGPYAVHVVGTRFSVEWDARDAALVVLVSEGRVRVTGGDLPASGVLLDPGGRLERRASKPPVENAAPVAREGEGQGSVTSKPSPDPAPISSGGPSVAALAAKGKYKEALSLAEKQGFSRLTLELPENDLLLLANAARYSGDVGRAREALTKLRERFRGRSGASLAALHLAKIAEDMTYEPAEATRWLRTFLRESPDSDLAAGARASLMSVLLRAGDRGGARAVAEDYLRRHPNGQHAADARALVSE